MCKHTCPGMAASHIRTSRSGVSSGGLSFTSLTLMLTRTLVSWWCPPTWRHRYNCHIQRTLQFTFIKKRFLFVPEYVCACLSSSSPPQLTVNNSQQGYVSIRASQAETCYSWFCKNYRRDKRMHVQDCTAQFFWQNYSTDFDAEATNVWYMLHTAALNLIDAPWTWTKWWTITW